METSPDNELMLRVQAGDLDSLGPLFERYKGDLFRYFFARTADRAASEDLVQGLFLRIIRFRGEFRPVGQFRAWMFRIAHNMAVDRNRRSARTSFLEDMEGFDPVSPASTAEECVLRGEELRLLASALDRLDEGSREVLVLSRYRNLSYREIGEALGCSEGAVKQRVFRAMTELRRIYRSFER